MGFFDGLGEVLVSPIKVVTKTVDNAINKYINNKFEE